MVELSRHPLLFCGGESSGGAQDWRRSDHKRLQPPAGHHQTLPADPILQPRNRGAAGSHFFNEGKFPTRSAEMQERELHLRFAALRRFKQDTRGAEWFSPSAELINFTGGSGGSPLHWVSGQSGMSARWRRRPTMRRGGGDQAEQGNCGRGRAGTNRARRENPSKPSRQNPVAPQKEILKCKRWVPQEPCFCLSEQNSHF